MDRFSYTLLIVAALVIGLSPLGQEPHLVEKTRMLVAGELRRPLDIFDFLFHLLPVGLVAWKVVHDLRRSSAT